MVKIFHEAPLSIFKEVQEVTDGDYALVHLFEEYVEYYQLFEVALKNGREVILDNSIFELGTAFDSKKYARWIEALKPTWFIVPDVLHNGEETIKSLDKFAEMFPSLPGKRIAVAQGKTVKELSDCYEYLHNHSYIDMVALTGNSPAYEELCGPASSYNKVWKWRRGRELYILNHLRYKFKRKEYYKPLHLLGCALPNEGEVYQGLDWIYSTDTSNPVVAGYEGVRYGPHGLDDKSKTKLFTIINEGVGQKQLEDILYNIQRFREFWGQ